MKRLGAWIGLLAAGVLAVGGGPAAGRQAADGVPALGELVHPAESDLRGVVERYVADRGALDRRYDAEYSPARRERLRAFLAGWRAHLAELDFDRLTSEGRIDYVLLDLRLEYELQLLEREAKQFAEIAALVPFAGTITALQEARRRMEPVDARASAGTLAALAPEVDRARAALDAALRNPDAASRPSGVLLNRAAGAVESLTATLGGWYRFYSGYDPLFTWWAADPFTKTDEALRAYSRRLRDRPQSAGAATRSAPPPAGGNPGRSSGVRPPGPGGAREGQREGRGEGSDDPIIGDPIGAEGLKADLALEMIPYSPEELLSLAEREFAWCEAEMKKAARDMGFGDDWRAAVEKVKGMHVEPGKQPELIRELALEAIDWVEKRNLVTVPPLAKETWRVEMMSAERQRVSPFFLGGEVILVSYPTEAMSHEDKLMSMRGNNRPFSRATVHHELIPGHHLQQFMTSRYQPHRRLFGTPFWTEGWSLYWEMLLWDQGFARTPEERVGMLFWRMHRAARIMFSLGFHLGRMTPDQAVDLLVNRVGHERANATAEVRRSFNGTYPPLYQAAYMLGGLQFRALHRELVESGKMTDRRFHDTILQGGPMPVEMVRARLLALPLRRDTKATWRFDPGR